VIRTPSLPGSSTCVRDGGSAAPASAFPAPARSVPQAVSSRAVAARADRKGAVRPRAGRRWAGLRIRSSDQRVNPAHVMEAIIPVTGVSQVRGRGRTVTRVMATDRRPSPAIPTTQEADLLPHVRHVRRVPWRRAPRTASSSARGPPRSSRRSDPGWSTGGGRSECVGSQGPPARTRVDRTRRQTSTNQRIADLSSRDQHPKSRTTLVPSLSASSPSQSSRPSSTSRFPAACGSPNSGIIHSSGVSRSALCSLASCRALVVFPAPGRPTVRNNVVTPRSFKETRRRTTAFLCGDRRADGDRHVIDDAALDTVELRAGG
jgi:hypothetical protein